MSDFRTVADVLTSYGRARILEDFTVHSCVASSRVTVEVLRYFGIAAQPKGVTAYIQNAAYLALEDRAKTMSEADLLASGAWGVGVTEHVVAWVPAHDAFIDLSLDQASRPHKGLPLEPSVFPLVAGYDWSAPVGYDDVVTGLRVVVDPEPDGDRYWRGHRNWRITPVMRAVIADTIRAARRSLEHDRTAAEATRRGPVDGSKELNRCPK